MQWEPTGSARAAVTGLQKRAKWVSKEKLDARRREGRCLRCGKPGHRKSEYPCLPARQPRYFNSTPRPSPVPENPPVKTTPSGPHRHTGQVNITKIKKEEGNASGTDTGADTDSEKE